jgi:signal transduction histidine kinase
MVEKERPEVDAGARTRGKRPSFRVRRITPVIIIVVTTLGLLVPMGLAFRASSPLSDSVDDLQLDWLRLAAGIDHVSPASVRAVTARLDFDQLRELSRFSPRLSDALSVLPAAITNIEDTVVSGERVAIEQFMAVDSLLSVVRDETEVLDEQQDTAYSGMLTFVMIAAVAFAVLWAHQTVRVSRLKLEARENRRIASLERSVRDHERSKLSRELHDGAAQELAVAGLAADLIAKDRSLDHLPALTTAIRSARDEMRLVYRVMDPRFRKPSELPQSLRELAHGIEQRSGQHFDVHIDPLSAVSWSSETLLHVYRIVQECMHNVVRHAEATWASVVLRVSRTDDALEVVIRVEDDGVGIDQSTEGYGRRGVRERVELLRGTVRWFNREPAGTVVEAVLPGE